MKTYLAVTMSIGAWIAADDGAPLLEVIAQAVTGPVLIPVGLAVNLYLTIFER